MKKSFILFFILFIVFFSSSPAQAGYWKLSGNGEIISKPEDHKSMITNSFDANHVDISYRTFDWDTEWSRAKYEWDAPPQIIRQDEVVPVSVSYSVTGFFREPRGCSVAFDIFERGASDARVELIGFSVKEDNPREGKVTNTKNKAPSSTGDRYMQYGCFLLEVSYPYKWVEDGTPTTVTTTTYAPTPTAAQSGTGYDNGMGAPGGSVIYSNGNAGGVYNNPTSQTTFTLTNTYNVMSISTYHYNSGRGATPGTISLKDSSGKTVGTWTATGRYRNFYWDVTPNIKLGPGTYTVIDSDTSTWAQNSETNNQGMFIVKGTLATTTGITPDKGTTTVTAKRTTPKPGATTPQGDFTVSISPTEMTVNPGENIRFTLTVEPEGDFNEPVEIYVMTEALGQEKNFGRVKTIYPPYKPYVFESAVPDSIPKGTTITGYVTAKGGGLERDAGTVIVNVPGFGALLAIGALGMAILLRKRR